VSAADERIPLARPVIGERERELVDEVLRSGQLSLGPMAPRFERAWADRIGVRHAVAVSSGTAGLHLCLHALGIGPGDEVVTSSFSFVASANAVLFTGARPVFAEVDPFTFNMDPAAVEAAITPRTKAILIVDIFGYPAEVPALVEVAERHGLARVEDACQTIDGAYDGRKLGTFGHPAVYGFYANKQLTTAEGGVVLTDDDELARTLASLRNQGRSDDGAWLVHSRLGFNYRLSDVHCAIGVAQLERLDEMMAGRDRVAGWYQERVREIDGVTPMHEGPQRRSWFVYAPRLDPDLARDQVIGDLDALGVSAKPYLPCIHLQPYYRQVHGHRTGELPVTEAISASTIALPFFPELTEGQVERVCSALAAVIARRRAPKGPPPARPHSTAAGLRRAGP
jgi:dTDP-4-amino-4,6-dideoxygalactose transaminase